VSVDPGIADTNLDKKPSTNGLVIVNSVSNWHDADEPSGVVSINGVDGDAPLHSVFCDVKP
jgi:hypothetical protein